MPDRTTSPGLTKRARPGRPTRSASGTHGRPGPGGACRCPPRRWRLQHSAGPRPAPARARCAPRPAPAATGITLLGAGLIALLATGCGRAAPDEVVARVNGTPIVAQELDLALERNAAATAEDLRGARRQLLQSLVIEELLAQQFRRTSPGSAQVDKFAAKTLRREMLARHFAASLMAKVPAPGCEEIRTYYRDHPQLYARRQVFDLRRLDVPAATPGGERELRERLTAAASLDEIVDWLRKTELRYVVSQTALGSDEVPAELAARLHGMNAGQVLLLPAEQGTQVVQLLGARAAPLDEAGAWPLIERRLWLERQSAALEAEIRKLSRMAAISLPGESAPPQAAASEPVAPQAPPATARDQGGPPAAAPSCSAQRAEGRRAEPNPPLEGLVQ